MNTRVFFLLSIWVVAAAVAPARGQAGAGATDPGQPDPQQAVSIDDLIKQAESALDDIPTTPRAKDRQNLLKTAQRLAVQVASEDPANPWNHYLRGRVWATSGSRPVFDAIGELDKFTETHVGQNYWKAHVALGDLFADAWPVQAKSKYLRADELNPNHAKTLYGLSSCESKLGNKEEALDYALRAVQASAADERIRYLTHLAGLYAVAKNWDEAYKAALEARDLAEARHRNDPTALDTLKTLESQFQVVINTVKGALSVDRGNSMLYVKLIEYIEGLADVRREIAAFEALSFAELGVANTAPNTPVSLVEKQVEILLYLGRRDDAVTLCEQILQRSPRSTVCNDLTPSPESTPQP